MSFQYDRRVQDALRLVVRDVLRDAARDGLEDPHHFYISIRTGYPGVEFPEMVKRPTLKYHCIAASVLDLHVKGFSVVLTFQDVPQKIYVPFNALLSFMDPGVRFGLHFTPPLCQTPCLRV